MSEKTKVGVLLSGCGVFDGAEIHEAVLSLYFLQKYGAEAICIAPNITQQHVINHYEKLEMGENRNVLFESARIARGDIKPLEDVSAADFDALFLPGGFGAAKNLTDFAVKGDRCGINHDVQRVILEAIKERKPVGAVCIAPVVIARAIKGFGIKTFVTIGNDRETADAIESMGTKHVECAVDKCVTDEINKIVTSPAYMLGRNIHEVSIGIEQTIKKLIEII